MATIPDCRDTLTLLADRLRKPFLSLAERTRIAHQIDMVVTEMYRRSAVRKAPCKAKVMTPAMEVLARAMVRANPDVPMREIGRRLGVDGGRISEAVAGRRT